MSSVPPIECIELAVEPFLDLNLGPLLEPGLELLTPQAQPDINVSYLGNGYSFRGKAGELGEKLSTERRGVGEAMVTITLLAILSSHTLSALIDSYPHRPPPLPRDYYGYEPSK